MFKSALEFSDEATFSIHLSARSEKIKQAIAEIFGRIPAASPEARELQSAIARALAPVSYTHLTLPTKRIV